jgi:hypothetical protein
MPANLTRWKVCRHCRSGKVNRPRGLCWTCYYSPGVRDEYHSGSKYARRGFGGANTGKLPLPAEPTDARPGTAAKIAVLRKRASRGEHLWHADDAA